MFCQRISADEHALVFPSFILVATILKFIVDNRLTATVVLPMGHIIPCWLPDIFPHIQDAFVLGCKGEKGIISVPSRSGFIASQVGLRDNLWVIRIDQLFLGEINDQKFAWKRTPGHVLIVGDMMIRDLL